MSATPAEQEIHDRRIERARLEALAATGDPYGRAPVEAAIPDEWRALPAGTLALHIFPIDHPVQSTWILKQDGEHGDVFAAQESSLVAGGRGWDRVLTMGGETYVMFVPQGHRYELINEDGTVADIILTAAPIEQLAELVSEGQRLERKS